MSNEPTVSNEPTESGGPPRRRTPRRITRGYLENVALWYLGRFAATAQGLRQVLMRRVHRASRHHGDDPAEGAELVEALIERYREAGLIDDVAFAEARTRTLFNRGLPVRAIRARLQAKGVAPADIDCALESALSELLDTGPLGAAFPEPDHSTTDQFDDKIDDKEGEADFAAARIYARRRRLGPWRRPADPARRDRDMAAMARAGFSYDVVRAIIDAEEAEDVPDRPPFAGR